MHQRAISLGMCVNNYIVYDMYLQSCALYVHAHHDMYMCVCIGGVMQVLYIVIHVVLLRSTNKWSA
jgi:hypothetical protein